MKIVKKIVEEKPFEPVYLKLETQEDVDKLYVLLNYSDIANTLFPDTHERLREELRKVGLANYRGYFNKLVMALKK